MLSKKMAAGVLAALMASSLFAGCGSDPKPEPPAQKQEQPKQAENSTIDVQINHKVEALGGGKYKVSCTTNLPDGMELMVTLSNQQSVRKQLGIGENEDTSKLSDDKFQKLNSMTFKAQDKVTVKDGKFEVTLGGEKLIPGDYDLEISSALTKLQKDENVKKRLGEKGENLSGKYVSEGLGGNKTVSFTAPVKCDK